MSESNIQREIQKSRLDIAFEAIALDALTPLLQASDAGKLIITPDVWRIVRESVTLRIAETYFGTHSSLPTEVPE
jgi:hypothetical protein